MRLMKWSLMALAATMLVGAASLSTRAADDTQPAKVVGSVSGKVVDSTGAAAKGAKVQVMKPHDEAANPRKGQKKAEGPGGGDKPQVLAEGVTNDDGSFKIDNVPVGKVAVVAMLKGTGFGRSEIVEIKANEETKLASPITLNKPKNGGGGGGKRNK